MRRIECRWHKSSGGNPYAFISIIVIGTAASGREKGDCGPISCWVKSNDIKKINR